MSEVRAIPVHSFWCMCTVMQVSKLIRWFRVKLLRRVILTISFRIASAFFNALINTPFSVLLAISAAYKGSKNPCLPCKRPFKRSFTNNLTAPMQLPHNSPSPPSSARFIASKICRDSFLNNDKAWLAWGIPTHEPKPYLSG